MSADNETFEDLRICVADALSALDIGNLDGVRFNLKAMDDGLRPTIEEEGEPPDPDSDMIFQDLFASVSDAVDALYANDLPTVRHHLVSMLGWLRKKLGLV
jgi:hypothetical protein